MAVSLQAKLLDKKIKRWARESRKRMRKEMRKRIRNAVKPLRKAMKDEFDPALTDKATRRRRDGGRGKQLGIVDKEALKAHRFKIRVRNQKDWFAKVGALKGKGAAKMIFHARGDRGMPKREVVTPAVKQTRKQIFNELGRAVRGVE